LLKLSNLPEAEFPGKEEFDHFECSDHPTCFACNSKRMLVRPLRVTDKYLLMEATTKAGDRFVVMPGVYLVFPRIHVEDFMDMPDDWTASEKDAASFLGLPGRALNFSVNWGEDAGQTVPHGHSWIIDRSMLREKGLTINVGLAALLYQSLVDGLA
jgi:hypothetical protein